MDFADDDAFLYELLNGEVVKKRAPTPRHQRIVRDVAFAMHQFVHEHLNLITNDGIMGVPTMVAKIISPSSIYHDRVIKKQLYERFGVLEYWLVDPADAYIEVFTLQQQSNKSEPARYELLSAASAVEGFITSNVFPNLILHLPTLFA